MSDTRKPTQIDVLRSPLGRVRGLGSARAGSDVWWVQRLTAVALVPLSLWFIYTVIHLLGASRDDIANWLSRPVSLVLMLALIAATFHHMQLGLRVVIEDYVHHHMQKLAAVLVIKAVTILLALACIVSVLRLGL
jgi:succinate dehydrogenase / fumarate reductase membrane anchor subunit